MPKTKAARVFDLQTDLPIETGGYFFAGDGRKFERKGGIEITGTLYKSIIRAGLISSISPIRYL